MANSGGELPMHPWQQPDSGVAVPVGSGLTGAVDSGMAEHGGISRHGGVAQREGPGQPNAVRQTTPEHDRSGEFAAYADFSPPSYGLPPSETALPVAGIPGTAAPAKARARKARARKARRREKSKLPWVVAGLLAVILAVIVLVIGFVTPGSLVRNVFDSRGVADGVRQILRDSYRIDGVGPVPRSGR